MAYALDELNDLLEDEGFYIIEVVERPQYFSIYIGDEMYIDPRQERISDIVERVFGISFNRRETYISGNDVVVEIDN
tara:strand:+ start:7074 stop:7304 length:231 start_codon:yes stop_codon:yes gene_type:complete